MKRDDWVVSVETKADGGTFFFVVVWIKKSVLLLKCDIPVKEHLCAESPKYVHGYPVHVSRTCLLFGCALFWLPILASLRRAGRKREETERAGGAPYRLLPSTCQLRPRWASTRSSSVAGSRLLNSPPINKKKGSTLTAYFCPFPHFSPCNQLAADLCTSDS